SSHYPLRSEQTHVYPEDPPYPRVMIYDVLKSVGYRTSIFSSQNEHWGKMINYLDTGGLDRLMHAETWDGPTYVAETDTGFAAWVANTQHAGSVDDRFTVGEAIKWIGEDPEHPFFLYMNLQNSHFPYVVPDDFERPFGPDTVDFRMTFNRYPQDKVPVVKALYADSLHYIDQQLARLFAALDEWELSDRTVIIVSGDTGQAFYEHDFASHGNALYDEVMRVPLVIAVPGMAPSRHDQLAQHLDVPPTLAGLLAIPLHPAWQGLDLFAPEFPSVRDVFLVVQTPIAHQYAIVRDGHKLIYDAKLDRSYLYDLESDPGEHMDVSSGKPELARELSDRLHTWRHLQLDYYANPLAQQGWYPPILGENESP
ncbi:MAG: sulfatase-like hydrolase/transferase, partial [Proteobacteria bacterium]|nr:sulfatase-like hydrolase/transferase [Pseudomonadota bacterium]